jgi:hypothetical protein
LQEALFDHASNHLGNGRPIDTGRLDQVSLGGVVDPRNSQQDGELAWGQIGIADFLAEKLIGAL